MLFYDPFCELVDVLSESSVVEPDLGWSSSSYDEYFACNLRSFLNTSEAVLSPFFYLLSRVLMHLSFNFTGNVLSFGLLKVTSDGSILVTSST